MSISAMKQAVKALEFAAGLISPITKGCQCQICLAHTALRQAIAEAEKQEPVTVKHMMDWVYQLKRFSNDGRYMNIPSGLSAGACYELAVEIEQFIKTEPVHAIDISQERVDETAKDKHEDWYGQHQWQCGYERGWDKAMERKREWVGLTKDEVDSWELPEKPTLFKFAQFVEAKLKEKNT